MSLNATTAVVLTTKGDIYTFDTAANRLPVGTNGQVLTADSTQALGVKWGAAGGSGTVTSITAGGGLSGGVITTSGTIAVIGVPTTKGDLWGYSTTNARVPIGTNNQVLTADSTQTLGLKWADPASLVNPTYIQFTSASSAITNNTLTQITNLSVANSRGSWTTTASTITIPITGWWRIGFCFVWNDGSSITGTYRVMGLNKNSASAFINVFQSELAPHAQNGFTSATSATYNDGTMQLLTSGDVLRLWVMQNSGGSLNFFSNGTLNVSPGLTLFYVGNS